MSQATADNPVYRWANIYGAPLGVTGDNTNEMNNNPEAASMWKGRVLIKYFAEDTKNPVMQLRNLSMEQIQESTKWQK